MAEVYDLSEDIFDEESCSKILWEIGLIWNGGRKEEIHSFYWSDSVDAVNEKAIGLWDELGDPRWRDCEDNVDGSRTRPGEPYQGFACFDAGGESCLITVAPVKSKKDVDQNALRYAPYVPTESYGIMNIKRILRSRQMSYKAGDTKEALAKRLYDYLDMWIPESSKEEQQEKEEKEKDAKHERDEKGDTYKREEVVEKEKEDDKYEIEEEDGEEKKNDKYKREEKDEKEKKDGKYDREEKDKKKGDKYEREEKDEKGKKGDNYERGEKGEMEKDDKNMTEIDEKEFKTEIDEKEFKKDVKNEKEKDERDDRAPDPKRSKHELFTEAK